MTHSSGAGRRILILGDSYIRGLGRAPDGFGLPLADALGGTEVLDLSEISTTAPMTAREHLEAIRAFRADFAIVNLGAADSLVFPREPIQKLIDKYFPPEWAGVEGMLPRARFSSDRRRRLRQRVEQAAKILLKQILIYGLGGHRRVSSTEFRASMGVILELLAEQQVPTLVIGFAHVDAKLFPKTNASFRLTNALLQELSSCYDNVLHVPIADMVSHHGWDDFLVDHAHLSPQGHRRVLAGIESRMTAVGPPWSSWVSKLDGVELDVSGHPQSSRGGERLPSPR